MDSAIMQQGMELFRSQGPIFWGAAAAIAAGVTVLVLTIFLFFRQRVRARRAASMPVDGTIGRAANLHQTPRPATSAAQEAENGRVMVKDFPDQEDLASKALLGRLRTTVVNLESLQNTLRNGMLPSGESPLKEEQPAVEYVFRQGTG